MARGSHLALAALLHDEPLLIQEITQDLLVQILEYRRLLVLVRHLLEELAERSILWIQLDAGREDPDARELALVVSQKQIQNYHRFPRCGGRCEEEACGKVCEWLPMCAGYSFCGPSVHMYLVF